MISEAAIRLLACPRCLSALEHTSSGSRCLACGHVYPRHPDGFIDLRPTIRTIRTGSRSMKRHGNVG